MPDVSETQQRHRLAVHVRLAVVAVGIVAAALCAKHAIATAPDARRVRTRPTAAERAAGVVRGRARFRAQGRTPVPPCMAKYEHGEETATSHFNGDSRVDFDDGATYVLPEPATIEFFDNEPPTGPASPAAVAYERKKKPDVEKFKLMACLGPDTPVWVEACARGKDLYGCKSTEGRVLIAVGGAAARAEAVTGRALGFVAFALAGACLACGALARVFAAPWRSPSPRARRVWRAAVAEHTAVVAAVAVIAAGCGVVAWASASTPWVLAIALAVLVVVLVGSLGRRVPALVAARETLAASERATLVAPSDGQERVIDVHVAADAPRFEGFRPGKRHSLIRFAIEEVVTDGDGDESTRRRTSGVVPNELCIEDASGNAAVLASTHAVFDLAEERGLTQAAPWPPWFAEVVGAFEPSPGHARFTITQSVVEPGAALVVFGPIDAAASAGGEGSAIYRKRTETPRIQGEAAAPVLVYLGTRAALARAVAAELTTACAALVLSLGASAAAVALARWVVEQG